MDQIVGVLGGGQLGRMMSEAAHRLGINIIFLDPGQESPAKQINASKEHLHGSFSDPTYIRQLADKSDVLTVEIEHVDAQVLAQIQKENPKVKVYPSPQTIITIQDKYSQKLHYMKHGIQTAESVAIENPPSVDSIRSIADKFGLPLMLKSRTLAYDGKGNYLLKSLDDIPNALTALGATGGANRLPPALYAEKFVPFICEIAVMVVKSANGDVECYPAVETIHKDNICHIVNAPLRKGGVKAARDAEELAKRAVASFGEGAAGVFGVEMFLLPDDVIVINEIAPRPHNSGHYTIEACGASQFENHLRAVLGLPIGDTRLKVPSSSMLNILGSSDSMEEVYKIREKALEVPGATVHLYGKKECRKGRKMGHITLTGFSDDEVQRNLNKLYQSASSSSSTSSTALAESLKKPLNYVAGEIAPNDPSLSLPPKGFRSQYPLVSIIMGSDSDLPVMKTAASILNDFGIPHELDIVSAHRTPSLMYNFAQQARSRGVRAIIAGAGGAAHLPGMVAAMTTLPVIGVPVKGSSLDGVDSLHSIVQMPRGVPVATVAINNSTNAALLALRILSTTDVTISDKLQKYVNKMESDVDKKREKLAQVGWDAY